MNKPKGAAVKEWMKELCKVGIVCFVVMGIFVIVGAPRTGSLPKQTTYVVSWTGPVEEPTLICGSRTEWIALNGRAPQARTFYVEEEARFFHMQQKVENHRNVSLTKRVVTEEKL